MKQTLNIEKEEFVLITCTDSVSESIYDYLLGTKKYCVFKVKDGQEAVNRAKTIIFDYILLDVQVPVLDAFTATKLIREFSPADRTKIIFLSEIDNYDIRDAAIAVGGNDYLVKPVEFSLLKETLNDNRKHYASAYWFA